VTVSTTTRQTPMSGTLARSCLLDHDSMTGPDLAGLACGITDDAYLAGRARSRLYPFKFKNIFRTILDNRCTKL
jgi:hypothetical protein